MLVSHCCAAMSQVLRARYAFVASDGKGRAVTLTNLRFDHVVVADSINSRHKHARGHGLPQVVRIVDAIGQGHRLVVDFRIRDLAEDVSGRDLCF